MKVLVTGAHGKVGRAVTAALAGAGHEVTASDVGRGVFERPLPGEPAYQQAELTDAGQAFAIVHRHDAVVHAAAIPDPTHNPPHVVFRNNLMATFNLIEAAVRFGLTRFVNLSSETVPGFFFPSARSCRGTRRLTSSTRSTRRIPTRCPSISVSSCATRPCGAATFAASRSGRATCSTRATMSATSGRRCATRAC